MKTLISIFLVQTAATLLGMLMAHQWPDHWWGRGAYLPLQVAATVLWVLAFKLDDRRERARARRNRERVEAENRRAAELADPGVYRRDVVAVALGNMLEDDFDRKWTGHVPPSPRPPRDRRLDVFKEVMTDPKYETWKCRGTFGLHEDGPCQCPAPKFKKGSFVRWAGDIWFIEKIRGTYKGDDGATKYSYCIMRDDRPSNTDGSEDWLTLALPTRGEWWEFVDCQTHHHAWDKDRMRPFVVTQEVEACVSVPDYVDCGCMRPVNFGKG